VQYSSDGLLIVACVDQFYTARSARSLALRKAPKKQCAVLHRYGICSQMSSPEEREIGVKNAM
jgi:hypothetical protein